uniref:Uncharacterized protein n=1 Tax=Brassica oleracea var. oleracea TaxID=109376 RepID=A0A0D3E6X9_BRAOL
MAQNKQSSFIPPKSLSTPLKVGLRRKPAAPTYSQMFYDGIGISSSGPSSSEAVAHSQTSQRVSWSPPSPAPHMPPSPPPAAAAPQPVPAGSLFNFGANNRVGRNVSETIKGYYDGAYPNWSKTLDHVKTTWFKCFAYEKMRVLPSMSDLFKMTHAISDGIFVDPASEKFFKAVASRVEEREMQLTQQSPDGLPVAPRKKGRIVGIRSVNEVAKATSSYASRRDEENSHLRVRMDSQQDCLDTLEDLLDVMAVGNLTMQRALNERRAALGCQFGIPKMPILTVLYRAPPPTISII